MLQILEESLGISEEPIGPEEREELRELRQRYSQMREMVEGHRSCSEESGESD